MKNRRLLEIRHKKEELKTCVSLAPCILIFYWLEIYILDILAILPFLHN